MSSASPHTDNSDKLHLVFIFPHRSQALQPGRTSQTRSRAAQRLHCIFDTSAGPVRARTGATCPFSFPPSTGSPSTPSLSLTEALASSFVPLTALLITPEALAAALLIPSKIVSGAISNETESEPEPEPEEVEDVEGDEVEEEIEPELGECWLVFCCSDAEDGGICLAAYFQSKTMGCFLTLPMHPFANPTRTCCNRVRLQDASELQPRTMGDSSNVHFRTLNSFAIYEKKPGAVVFVGFVACYPRQENDYVST